MVKEQVADFVAVSRCAAFDTPMVRIAGRDRLLGHRSQGLFPAESGALCRECLPTENLVLIVSLMIAALGHLRNLNLGTTRFERMARSNSERAKRTLVPAIKDVSGLDAFGA